MDNKKITKKYCKEISEIMNIIRQLKSNRIYEISGARCDGYLYTQADKLEQKINNLLYKIENNIDGGTPFDLF